MRTFPLMMRALACAALILPVAAPAQEAATTDPAPQTTRAPWDKEILDTIATLPVQDEGRVKPFDTFAQFTMLKLNGKRSFTTAAGERLNHNAWLLDCLFYPEIARDYACFIVDNAEVITAIGVASHAEKRGRYSYNELKEGRQNLMRLASEYGKKEANERSPIESMILNLANNIFLFEQVTHYFDFAFRRYVVTGDTRVAKAFPEAEGVPLSVALARVPQTLNALRADPAVAANQDILNAEVRAMGALMDELDTSTRSSIGIAIFPPDEADKKEWMTPHDLMLAAIDPHTPAPQRLGLLASWEKLPLLRNDRAAFLAELRKLHDGVVAAATARGEYAKVPLEVHFYRAQYLYYSQVLFVLSFLLVALSWLMPRAAWYHRFVTPASVLLPLILLTIGITIRCIIRGRPPVSTLYETILFITAVAVAIALLIEWMNRQRIGIAIASFLGMLGMFLAFRYEAKEGVDTMPSLIAVLDTNFWLATHVTTVTIGYAAGLLSGALAHIYLLGKLVGFRRNNPEFYKSITRMVYGVLCFGLLFSVIGTILGGIWANDSWGRFWGWDPKENGALMICLWSLVVLHARMGGYIRDLGINMCAVILAMIVAFSWWGVNNLGVGLHSYGFTSGVWLMLGLFWAVELLVLLAGIGVWMREESRKKPQTPAPRQSPARG